MLSHRRPSQTSEHDITEVSSDQCAQLLLMSDEDPSKPKSVAEMLSVDMTGLDSSLSLDPVLSELASQVRPSSLLIIINSSFYLSNSKKKINESVNKSIN